MGFSLTLIAIVAFITIFNGGLEYSKAKQNNHNRRDTIKDVRETVFWACGVCTFLAVLLYVAVLGKSYDNYIQMQKKAATIEQQASSVSIYTQYGVASFLPGKMLGESMTDFKYGAYQTELADLIRSLRDNIKDYNETLVGKQTMKSNWYWSCVIYLPAADYEVINMAKLIRTMQQETKEAALDAEDQEDAPDQEPTMDPETEKDHVYNYEGGTRS